jgi:hypothetical protein
MNKDTENNKKEKQKDRSVMWWGFYGLWVGIKFSVILYALGLIGIMILAIICKTF